MSLVVRGVSVISNTRLTPILSDIAFEVPAGSLTVIVGKTGAGKSTLLEVMAGIRKPDEGCVLYDDVPLWEGKRVQQSLFMDIGFVFQSPDKQLFAQTVKDEFRYSLRPYGLSKEVEHQRVTEALERVGLKEDLLERSPLTLSTGQKRRVILAATFATRPKWLFLDEPTAGLDPMSAELLVHWLTEFREAYQGTVIVATHDLDTFLPIADRVIVLSEGRVFAQTSLSEWFEHPDVFIQAGVGLPSALSLSKALAEKGISVGGAQAMTAKDMAQSIANEVHRLHASTGSYSLSTRQSRAQSNQALIPTPVFAATAASPNGSYGEAFAVQRMSALLHTSTMEPFTSNVAESRIQCLDPRAKWAFYTCLSAGILVQGSWAGLMISFVLTSLIWLAARLPLRRMGRLAKSFTFLTVISLIVSGVRFSHAETTWHVGVIGYDIRHALVTFQSICKLWLLYVCGTLFAETTSALQMKRGLRETLKFLSVLKVPVEALSFGASLILRFIPDITREFDRFRQIARVRGKTARQSGVLSFWELRSVLVPFVIAILELGDHLATAMEARGYRSVRMNRTNSVQLKFSTADWVTLCLGVLVFAFLFIVKWVIEHQSP
jgi:energy-coupling factor transport system permease/ATP-binding protein